MKISLKVITLAVSISSLRCELQQGGKYCSLTSVVQQIERRKAHKTLRSAERIPTLSAACKPSMPFSNWRGVSFLLKQVYFIF